MAKGKFSQPRVHHRPELTMKDVDFSVKDMNLNTQIPDPKDLPPLPEKKNSIPEPIKAAKPDPDSTMPLPKSESEPDLGFDLNAEAAAILPPIPQPTDSEDEFEEDAAQYGYLDPAAKRKKITFICLCAVAAVLLIGVIIGGSMLLKRNADDGLILNNVTVAGVNIGGMTQEMAAQVLHQATDQTYTQQDMVITLPDATINLAPTVTGAKLDVDAVVQEAFNYGRTGSRAENKQARQDSLNSAHHIAVLPYLNLDTAKIQSVLNEYGSYFNSEFRESSVKVTGKLPQLNAAEDDFDLNAECQVLNLDLGMPGRNLDINQVFNEVLDAYSFNRFSVAFEMADTEQTPEGFDLKELYDLYYKEPSDATMDMETFEVIPGTYGYDFDLEAAQKALEEAAYGDVVEIPFRMVPPEHGTDEMAGTLFRDNLGSYSTAHSAEVNRNTNLTLACKAINGLVLYPGDIFDYNKVVGQRTTAAGFKAAPAYSGGETVMELGGGVCQVSSTIYYCALIADLEIVTRQPHSFVSSYMPMGMDATVSWGGPEFRFKNNTNYPIRIEAYVDDKNVNIKLLGTDEKDYYVKMEYQVVGQTNFKTETEVFPSDNEKGYKDGDVVQTPYTGYTVQTYKCKYNKETNMLISKEKEALSAYKVRDKIVAKIEDPTEATTEPTTEPSTEATTPTETTAPPAETTAPPEETTAPPAETTTPPAETTSPPAETTELTNP